MNNKQAATDYFNYCEEMRLVPTTNNLFTHKGARNLWYVSYDSQTMVLYSYASHAPIVIYDREQQLYYLQCYKPTKTTAMHERLARSIASELISPEHLRFFFYVPTNYTEAVGEIQQAIDNDHCPLYDTYEQCKEAYRL